MSSAEEARLLCFGPPGSEDRDVDTFVNRRGERLFCRYWRPANGDAPKALAFVSHGFSEHLNLYHSVGNALADQGVLVFGHDFSGHGKSEGKAAYVETVDDYVDDLYDHCLRVRNEHGRSLPLFLIGHSMGGMVSVKMALDHPDMIKGMVLVGPLIIPGRSVGPFDLRINSATALVGRFALSCLDLINPELALGYVDYNLISRDEEMKKCMKEDPHKWHGGCKVRLLLAFVKCLEENYSHLAGVNVPFMVYHGAKDWLCNVVGSRVLSEVAYTRDKRLVEFPEAKHQLYLELPEVRTEVLQGTVDWILKRV